MLEAKGKEGGYKDVVGYVYGREVKVGHVSGGFMAGVFNRKVCRFALRG